MPRAAAIAGIRMRELAPAAPMRYGAAR